MRTSLSNSFAFYNLFGGLLKSPPFHFKALLSHFVFPTQMMQKVFTKDYVTKMLLRLKAFKSLQQMFNIWFCFWGKEFKEKIQQ